MRGRLRNGGRGQASEIEMGFFGDTKREKGRLLSSTFAVQTDLFNGKGSG